MTEANSLSYLIIVPGSAWRRGGALRLCGRDENTTISSTLLLQNVAKEIVT